MEELDALLNKKQVSELIFIKSKKQGLIKLRFLNKELGGVIITTNGRTKLEVYLKEKMIPREIQSGYFSHCENIEKINFNGLLDFSQIEKFNYMFVQCLDLEEIDFGNTTFTSLKELKNTFGDCVSLTSIKGLDFNCPMLRNMEETFLNCGYLKEIDFTKAQLPSVSHMSGTFEGCSYLKEVDLSNASLNQLLYVDRMFKNCTRLEHAYIKEKVFIRKSSEMFLKCENIKKIEIEWDFEQATDIGSMFEECTLLEYFDFSKFAPTVLRQMKSMFKNCINLKGEAIFPTMNYAGDDISNMFKQCNNITKIDMSNVSIKDVYCMNDFASDCDSLKSIEMGDIKGEKINLTSFAPGCKNLKYISLEKVCPGLVYNADYFVSECEQLEVVKLGFSLGSIETAFEAFAYCHSLKVLQCPQPEELRDENDEQNIRDMFKECDGLAATTLVNMNIKEKSMFSTSFPENLKLVYLDSEESKKYKTKFWSTTRVVTL